MSVTSSHVTVFTRGVAPALPPEARQLKEDNGSAGYTSLLVLVVCVVAGSLVLAYGLQWESVSGRRRWRALVAYVLAVRQSLFQARTAELGSRSRSSS
jgi:hypothetical protein